jgi:Flp pilus assembly protein TadB
MDSQIIIGLFLLAGALVLGVAFFYYFFAGSSSASGSMSALMGRSGSAAERHARLRDDRDGSELEKIKELTKRKAAAKKPKASLEEKLFQAGIFSERDKRDFYRMRILAPCLSIPIGAGVGISVFDGPMALMTAVMGLLVGLQLPKTVLDRKIQWRNEEIMFYLPLVIEQIAIGVSSSLDVGPCLQRIVQMADERDTHNPVTILIRQAQYHVKSGASLESALSEIGILSGHTELKHAFMSLSQVARHGGEITRQLQELADSVASQRETRIEAKIKKLELQATAPVGLVFLGFILILLVGFGIQMKDAFN